MKEYLIIIREPDGRKDVHPEEVLSKHQQDWKTWLGKMAGEGRLKGGKPLTLEGRVVKKNDPVSEGPYVSGTEIVGGYLIIRAEDIDEAVSVIQTSPVFDFDGFVEVRAFQDMAL